MSGGEAWQEAKDIRLSAAKIALAEFKENWLGELKRIGDRREGKAARVYLEGYLQAQATNKEKGTRQDPEKAGLNAMRRAGFQPRGNEDPVDRERREKIEKMERTILGDEEWERTFGDNQDWWKNA